MRNHTLMQTIARANRVFLLKLSGLIVDYIGVFRNLQEALAIYGSAKARGVDFDKIHTTQNSLVRTRLWDEALDAMLESYSDEQYWDKCQEVYQHIYESYYGEGQSIYDGVS
jgi:type I restriction enzyme R subunit